MSKGYRVTFGKRAQKNLKKMDRNDSRIIMAWIAKNLVDCQDPYKHGKPLKDNLKGKWRYRVGDYRLITNISEESVTILVLEAGHRREIYQQ